MLRDTSREIRFQLRNSLQRRLRRSEQSAAFDYLDRLIDSLEELHLRDHVFVSTDFDEKLRGLDRILPADVKRPRSWPTQIRRLLDTCFDLQEELLRRRVRGQALPPDQPSAPRPPRFLS